MNICNYCEHEKTCTNKPLATTRCKDYKEMSKEWKCPSCMQKAREIEKLKEALIKIQEVSIPHSGSLVFFQSEIRAINRYCKVALGKDTDVPANPADNNVGSMEKR